MTPKPPEKASLQSWVQYIRDQEMPIFGQTVQQVVNVAEDEEAPASRLANVILQDASMTARILRVANSPYYNPRRQRVSTVSRSVVVLGFDTVRAMCLTITLVDTFVHGEPREQLIHELARAIHAAVQARTIALQRGDDSPEEVFVATLLYHLGDLAFWCFGGTHAKRLAALKKDKESALSEEEAEQEVLGFPLRRLTQGLASEWKLNELLTNVLKDPKRAGTRGRNVSLSYRLATAAEKGWNDPEVKGLMKELGELIGQPPEKTTEMVHANAKEAARIAHYYGASTAARTIPVPGQWQLEDDEAEEEPAAEDYPEPDGMLQLRVLRELATFLESGKADFNLVMELVLEGMYRGIGLDRTLFALLTPDRRGLRGKYGVGRGGLADRFQFVAEGEKDLLFEVIEKKTPVWVDPGRLAEVPKPLQAVVGKRPFLIGPIVIGKRPIGLFYADRTPSKRDLTEEDFEAYKHFVQQANLAITHLTGKGK